MQSRNEHTLYLGHCHCQEHQLKSKVTSQGIATAQPSVFSSLTLFGGFFVSPRASFSAQNVWGSGVPLRATNLYRTLECL